ncbi:MAG: hypothetical protein QNJ63_28680 [Calothrix sp. MO_192.B10]|nr:hypothetical protein [Calothrix sp. MO_192.B10]
MNYSGFCFAQMRYLSDEEKIRSVFDYQNARSRLPINFQYYDHIKYESFDEYIKENPDCCRINTGEASEVASSNFVDRIFGFNSGDVIFTDFQVRYLDENGKQTKQVVRFYNRVQNCGKTVTWY